MEFRDLSRQYTADRTQIDKAICSVIQSNRFISGPEVEQLEEKLADYTGVKHCITCANGTDALQLSLMAWKIGKEDAVFVPDFTFFSSGEVVSTVGALPVFVDVDESTFNISSEDLEKKIEQTYVQGKYKPKVIIAVDLFGQPANFIEINRIAKKYGLLVLEDGAQGFGGGIGEKKACSFGNIATTSFFPAKPLGCYGDGGAIFTDSDEWDTILRSLRVHGKGESKYDNIRIGMNSRLDTIQAAILLAKFQQFTERELEDSNKVASEYSLRLNRGVSVPEVCNGFYSSWAQYTIRMENKERRDGLQKLLKESNIPSIVYYQKPMHRQKAFGVHKYNEEDYPVTNSLCDRVLSLPFHPYMKKSEIELVCDMIDRFMKG